MSYNLRAFGLIYKLLGPTGSAPTLAKPWSGSLLSTWWTDSVTSGSVQAPQSLVGYPREGSDYTPATPESVGVAVGYRALSWGSLATDFLWNVRVPSWSYTTSSVLAFGGSNYVTQSWRVEYTSKSFSREYSGVAEISNTYGVEKYPVTSSWFILDPKHVNQDIFHYVTTKNGSSIFPVYVGSTYTASGTDLSDFVAYDISYPNIQSNSSSSIDGQYFDKGVGGAAITRLSVSQSIYTQSAQWGVDTALGLKLSTEALKSRRLIFPITTRGRSITGGGDNYYFNLYTGLNSDEIFTDNGGIYNVQFTLKRLASQDIYPDIGTYMSIFIHDVVSSIPSSSARLPGAPGWYPPNNNIVTIWNGYGGGSAMPFLDPQTGYMVERFSVDVIQYGYPAQLCFEPSGSGDSFFGCIIDDVQICKIGVTTDSRFIKPIQTANSASRR